MASEEQDQARDPLVRRITNLFDLLFSYIGGIGRARYWAGLVAALVLLFVSLAVVAAVMTPTGPGDAGLAIPPLLLAFWISSAVTLKRLRDAGFAGWHSLVFVGGPIVLIIAGIELFWPLILLGVLLLIAVPGFYAGKPKRT